MEELLCCFTLDCTGEPNLDIECLFLVWCAEDHSFTSLQCTVEIQCICEYELCSVSFHFPSIPDKNKKYYTTMKTILADTIISSMFYFIATHLDEHSRYLSMGKRPALTASPQLCQCCALRPHPFSIYTTFFGFIIYSHESSSNFYANDT